MHDNGRANNALYIVAAILFAAVISLGTLVMAHFGIGNFKLVSDAEYEVIERYSRLNSVYMVVKDKYYKETSDEELLTGAIDGMLDSLDDRYTFYYTADEMEAVTNEGNGIFYGVGVVVSVNSHGQIEIVKVYEDSPAEAGGAVRGDIITAIDGTTVSGTSAEQFYKAIDMISGEQGTQVTLSVMRGEEKIDLTMTRGEFKLQFVEYELLDGNIAYISISQFEGDAVEKFSEAIDYFKGLNVEGLILDIRNNTGGYLDVVLEIADDLLPECMITSIVDRYGNAEEYSSDEEYWDVPVAVLINDSSASASELLAAAIRDNGRGILVGNTTYGKGVVQTVLTFPDDGAGMQLTTATYYTPSGECINEHGVDPDIEVDMNEDAVLSVGEPDIDNDNQLKSAYEAISN